MDTDAKAKGGRARAESLSDERKTEIARNAAQARWDANILQASHDGELTVGGAEFFAAVLPNGKRVLTQGTFLQAIGRSRTPKAGTGGLVTVDGIPSFLQAEMLKPFLTEELLVSTTPVFFKTVSGKKAVGYDAQLLPMVGEVYLSMRDSYAKNGKTPPKQYAHIIEACDVLMRGLARVGIIALVDEATGYQDVRDRQALQEILDRYLSDTLAAWTRTFPDEFYKQLFRLRKWEWRGMKINRPQCVARYTNDLVYDRIAKDLIARLEAKNPIQENGGRKSKHFQWLSSDIGYQALKQHLYGVVGLMRVSRDWDHLQELVDGAYPKPGKTNLRLSFDD